MFSAEATLQKKGWRKDVLWTNSLAYKYLKSIPLYFDTRALLESQYWPRHKIETLAANRLASLIRDAYSIPLWKQVFDDAGIDPSAFGTKDLLKIPIGSKKDFTGVELSHYTNSSLLPKSYLDRTSGSTGKPFEFYFDLLAELRSFAVCERMFLDVTKGKRLPVISLRSRPKIGFAFKNHILFFIRGYSAMRHRLKDFLDLMKKNERGCVLYSYSTPLLELARLMENENLRTSVKALISTGESLRESERAYIEKIFEAPFRFTYATRELGWLGFECENNAMHINEEWALVEIVDDEGNLLLHGQEGRIVVTPFDNRVMPFIRYDSGDRGVLSDAACPCGRTLRTLRFSGRQRDFIQFPDGRTVSLFDIAAAFDAFPHALLQYQIIQLGVFSFSIKVLPTERFEEFKKHLEGRLIRSLHPSATITWEVANQIPKSDSGKAIYFIRAF